MLEKSYSTKRGRQKVKRERRLHPRLDHNLPVKIAAGGYDFSTTTQNVSSLGAYCHIGKYIPPFTKIAIKLNLPVCTEHGKEHYDVECNGVIVRSEDAPDGGFNVAIFFNEIKESQKKIIAKYVNQFISQEVTCQ
ncbi:MAG: PilZ domain-containing protein [Candidatus Omnitrophica bacterium]|nr:PilZ domain-containing protein [Candidatus Omnitrophota bacterium]